jgi:UMF1 family MFS transporter
VAGLTGREREPRLEITTDGELRVVSPASRLERWSWAFYDFANTIFSMNIATLYFAVWIVVERGASATAYSLATSLSSLSVLLLAPWLGLVSDASRRRKPWVVSFTLLCFAGTLALWPMADRLGMGVTLPFLALFALANAAYQLALPFYNAMMPELVPLERQGRLSGLGTALGYAGSISGVLLVSLFVEGRLGTGGGRQAAFAPTAFLFLFFSLPLFLFCHDHLPRPTGGAPRVRYRDAMSKVIEAFRETRRYPGLRRFLIASLLYQDALGTAIAFMALYAVSVLGLARGEETTLFVTLTVPAIAGSFAAGWLSDRIGPKRTLLLVVGGWVAGLAAVGFSPSLPFFWAAGGLLGFVFGGIWAVERPLLLSLVPDVEAGRFFGLLVLSARAAAVAGPLVWALLVDGLSPAIGRPVAQRAAVLSLALFMVGALLLLRGIPERRRTDAQPPAPGATWTG